MAKKIGDFIQYPGIPATTTYLQYKGIFDLQDLYESIADFFRQKKFKFYEIQQRHRRPGPFGAELYYNFRATRKVEEFYSWTVYVVIETFDTRDIEVVLKDGTKKKMTKGRLWFQIRGEVEIDYEKIWDKSAFFAQLKNFYNKYVIKKRIESVWWDQLQYKIVMALHAHIKERLKMTSEGYQTRFMHGVH
ncbi:hypothetical protein HYV80_00395 [Candidatus Woesearchaeota archaeon]|nr:hypothetical protein [Candidatus Woesearchaeota archaeon]